MVELRDYQRDLLQKTLTALGPRSVRVMMQLPTGGGKTIIASQLLAGWLRNGRKADRLTHRKELADQTCSSDGISVFRVMKLLERYGEDPSQFRVQLS